MNKKFFAIPLFALMLIGCTKPAASNVVSETPSEAPTSAGEVTSQAGGNSENSGSAPVTANDGSLEHPYTVAEAIALCDAFGAEKEGKFIKNAEVHVTGTFDAGTKVDTYHSWEGLLDGLGFSIWSCKVASGITVTESNGALDGKKVVIKGYCEYYNSKYQMGYLPAASSPTGAKYNPTIVKIENGTTPTPSTPTSQQQGDATKSYGILGTKDTTAQTKVLDLTEGKTKCPAYDAGDKNIVKDITFSGENFKECNCYNSSNAAYWQFGAKKYGGHAWLASQTACTGTIVGLILKVPAGASGNTRYSFGFSVDPINEAFVEGDPIKPISEGSQSSVTADIDMVIVPVQGGNFKYFNVTAQFLEKNQFNGGGASITVLYK